ncbi:serine hydrolase [Larkinella insperata]|uniref:Serine hydrolase n=1 Tax=Larkinella insperata TaxID=332158 RepID=A0ABW3QH33_9BACT
MNGMNHYQIKTLLLFLTVAPFFAKGQTSPLLPKKIDSLVQRVMQERRIPGAQVAVVQRGQLAFLQSYGIANVGDSVPVTHQTRFAINSCTKAFTGVAIMQLVEEGQLDLGAPVSRYLDGLPAAWQPVTIRQLLTHVSGLPDMLRKVLNPSTGALMGQDDEQSAWAKVQTLPLEFPTGEQFSYNQTNYVLLGKIIDKLAAKPFARMFQEKQFAAAGMTQTVFGDSRDVIPQMAQQYRYVTNLDGHPLTEPRLTHFYYEFPPSRRTASGLNSTAEELARWLMALQQNKLLTTKAALATLWTPGSYNNGAPTQWALGWMTKPRAKHAAVYASGGGRSAFFVYPQDALAVVVLTNLAGAFPEDFIEEVAACFEPEILRSDPILALQNQLQMRGFDQAISIVKEAQKQRLGDPLPPENDLNDWGYRLMSRGRLTEALEIFKLTVYLYPQSWNVYDSYGEALFRSGQKEAALAMYKKSVLLNPNNRGGKAMLERLSK